MPNVEKVGTPKDIWVMCPSCRELFYIHSAFYEAQFKDLKLHCPFCKEDFAKEDAAKTWGAD